MLIKPTAFDEIATSLASDDFFLPAHREIFEAMLALDKRRQPMDIIAVADELKTRGMLARLDGGEAYLIDLANAVPTAENIAHYVRLVQEKATLRRLIAACAEIQSSAYGDFGDYESFLDEAETKVFKVAQQNRRETYSAVRRPDEGGPRLPRGRAPPSARRSPGVPTGFHEVRRHDGGPAAREPDHRRGAPRRRQDLVGGERRDERGACTTTSRC